MLRLTKRFRFEAAHAILNYDGPCSNIHGHSYVLEVTVTGPKQEDTGMVVDFKVIKKVVEEQVLNYFDHALLFNHNHPDSVAFQSYHGKTFSLPFEPTAENLLEWMAERIQPAMPAGVVLAALKLVETESSFAEWVNE